MPTTISEKLHCINPGLNLSHAPFENERRSFMGRQINNDNCWEIIIKQSIRENVADTEAQILWAEISESRANHCWAHRRAGSRSTASFWVHPHRGYFFH